MGSFVSRVRPWGAGTFRHCSGGGTSSMGAFVRASGPRPKVAVERLQYNFASQRRESPIVWGAGDGFRRAERAAW
jgi:hypothetical protein